MSSSHRYTDQPWLAGLSTAVSAWSRGSVWRPEVAASHKLDTVIESLPDSVCPTNVTGVASQSSVSNLAPESSPPTVRGP